MKKAFLIGTVAFFVFLLIYPAAMFGRNEPENWNPSPGPTVVFKSNPEKELYVFLSRNLKAENEGIFTNYLPKGAVGDLPAGHDILSESVSLMMQYALEADSRRLFDSQMRLLKQSFVDVQQRISWKFDPQRQISAKSNSLIDDLRIVGLLMKAFQKWHQISYLHLALQFGEAIKEYNFNHSLPVDYYDYQTRKPGLYLTLSYIDIETIREMARFDQDWLEIYNHTRQVLEQGERFSNFPAKKFNVIRKVYENNSTINSVDLMIVIEHQVDHGKAPVSLLNWLKKTYFDNKRFVNEYNYLTERESTIQESPAVYALSCRIFLKTGEVATAQKLYHQMLNMRVRDRRSRFYGGYADLKTHECYSFDNLQALITIRYWNNRFSN